MKRVTKQFMFLYVAAAMAGATHAQNTARPSSSGANDNNSAQVFIRQDSPEEEFNYIREEERQWDDLTTTSTDRYEPALDYDALKLTDEATDQDAPYYGWHQTIRIPEIQPVRKAPALKALPKRERSRVRFTIFAPLICRMRSVSAPGIIWCASNFWMGAPLSLISARNSSKRVGA